MSIVKYALITGAALLAAPAMATDFSFSGNFGTDSDVLLFNFTVGADSTVTLRSYSYAGGVNAAGQTIAAGGFDPILSVYDTLTGNLIDRNDDGSPPDVPADPVTGNYYDTYFTAMLFAGSYTVAVTQFDNFGPANLALPFDHANQSTFTSGFGCTQGVFCDFGGNNRDNHWAFDILGVDDAVQPPSAVPEPATWALMLVGFGGMGYAMRRNRKVAVTFS